MSYLAWRVRAVSLEMESCRFKSHWVGNEPVFPESWVITLTAIKLYKISLFSFIIFWRYESFQFFKRNSVSISSDSSSEWAWCCCSVLIAALGRGGTWRWDANHLFFCSVPAFSSPSSYSVFCKGNILVLFSSLLLTKLCGFGSELSGFPGLFS